MSDKQNNWREKLEVRTVLAGGFDSLDEVVSFTDVFLIIEKLLKEAIDEAYWNGSCYGLAKSTFNKDIKYLEIKELYKKFGLKTEESGGETGA